MYKAMMMLLESEEAHAPPASEDRQEQAAKKLLGRADSQAEAQPDARQATA